MPLRAFVEGAYRDLDERTPQLSFAEEEYADRLMRLRKAMADASIDTVVLTAPDSMCWLHGYQSRWYRAHSPTDWPPLQCTVVNGRILMRNRKVLSLSPAAVLSEARAAAQVVRAAVAR